MLVITRHTPVITRHMLVITRHTPVITRHTPVITRAAFVGLVYAALEAGSRAGSLLWVASPAASQARYEPGTAATRSKPRARSMLAATVAR